MSDQFTRDENVVNKLYNKMVEIRAQKRADAANHSGPTSDEILDGIMSKLRPVFGHNILGTSKSTLTDQEHLMLVYASVPKTSHELDAHNAKSNPMFSISAEKGDFWFRNKPSPPKVRVEWVRGSMDRDPKTYKSRVKFRAKSDSGEKIVKYVVDFFMKNKAALLSNDKDV